MRKRETVTAAIGACPDCGKNRYTSKRNAKSTAKLLYPGDHLSAYQCGEYWHIGHLDLPIMRGITGRGH